MEDGASENNKWRSSTRPVRGEVSSLADRQSLFVTSHRLAQDVSWCVCVRARACLPAVLFSSRNNTSARGEAQKIREEKKKRKKQQVGEETARCLIQSDAYKLNCTANQRGTLTGARSEAVGNASKSAKGTVPRMFKLIPVSCCPSVISESRHGKPRADPPPRPPAPHPWTPDVNVTRLCAMKT